MITVTMTNKRMPEKVRYIKIIKSDILIVFGDENKSDVLYRHLVNVDSTIDYHLIIDNKTDKKKLDKINLKQKGGIYMFFLNNIFIIR